MLTRNITRRGLILGGLALTAAFIGGCGGRGRPADPLPSVDLTTFPAGLGRGYPLATLEGADNREAGVQPGDTAPNFRLQLDNGDGLYLRDLVGRPVLINFWATWCGPCRLEMPDIVRHAQTDPDLVVVAVNVQEEVAQIEPFAQDFAMELPIARDANGEISNLYEVRGMPTTYFVDREGKVNAVWAGALSPARLEEMLAAIL